jgi:hypothetical protein
MNKIFKVGGALAAVSILASCGDSSAPNLAKPYVDIPVPGVTAAAQFSFDLGIVTDGRYYVTDRNNKALDAVEPNFVLNLVAAGAFVGCKPLATCVGANNALSGPDGINAIPGTTLFFVGDVDNVRVVDRMTGTVTKSIKTGTAGVRADEGCVDPDHNIYMISSPEAPTPFATFISIPTQTVIATVQFTDPAGGAGAVAAGLEQCQYNPGTQSFLVNNDGTTANPHGEVDVIPVSSIQALAAGATTTFAALANTKVFPLGACDPTGMTLGPGTDMMVECRPGDKGAALVSLIMNRTNGTVVTTVPFGGGDQITYDARTNRYYIAGSRWHASGVNDQGGACAATNLCTPMLGVVDAATRSVVRTVATGNNAHSVAVDPVAGWIYLPYSSATTPAGCGTCTANGFLNGGISVFGQ